MEKIDFVIIWVDGSDPKWLSSKQEYEKKEKISSSEEANSPCRYRDDGLLRYWFRGVEKYAPWVNRIHFVTCGQKPEWLNENHPKLQLVNHVDFIPSKYLPTFNANTIEMNFHRIVGLSEQFVFFNDDMFLLQPLNPDFFFKNNNPVLDTDLKYPSLYGYNNWSRLMFNDYCLVNKSFDIKKSIWSYRGKWFNLNVLGLKRAGNNFLCFLVNKTLPVGQYGHFALPHLKSTLVELWERLFAIMDNSCMHKFREDDQVNQWLCCAWNQAKGRFYPANKKNLGARTWISPGTLGGIVDIICNQKAPQICVNDNVLNVEPEHCAFEIAKAFESIFPQKSSFEK